MIKKLFEFIIIIALLIALTYIGREKLAAYYYNQGLDSYNKRSYDEAISFLEKSAGIKPVAVTHHALGSAYRQKQETAQAIEEYQKAIEIDPDNIDFYYGLADICTEALMYDKAINILKRAKAKGLDSQAIDFLLKQVYMNHSKDLYNRGVILFSTGNKRQGYELLHKASEIAPDLTEAYYALGSFYFKDQDYKKAQANLQKAVKINPRLWEAQWLLADIDFEKGDYEQASKRYKQALAGNPYDFRIFNDAGIALMRMERYDEALKYLEKAIRLDPGNIDLRYNLASTYRDAGRPEDAVAEYNKVKKQDPGYPRLHNNLADIFLNQKKPDKAAEEYRQEISYSEEKLKADPYDVNILNNLAYAYSGLGEYKKAEEIISKAIAISPDFGDAYLTLAKIKQHSGREEEASLAAARARELIPHGDFIHRDFIQIKTLPVPEHVIYLKNGRQIAGVITLDAGEKIFMEVRIGSSKGTIGILVDDIDRIEKYETEKRR